jgi:predicted GH43/DUF377 family glycosyl hydrolase
MYDVIVVVVLVIILVIYIINIYHKREKKSVSLNSILFPLKTSSNVIQDWSFINPSIAKYTFKGEPTYIILHRIHQKKNLLFWRSKIGYSIINLNGTIIKEGRFEDLPGNSFFACGYEDPRVFIHNKKVYTLAVLVESTRSVQYLLELDIEKEKIVKYVRLIPDFESESAHQKNWVPIKCNGKYLFATRVEPHIIVKVNFKTGKAKKLYSTSNKELIKIKTDGTKIHGGTSPIQFSGRDKETEYLSICHLKRGGTYTSIFYKYNHLFQITQISKEFTLPLPKNVKSDKIQMITGLELLDKDNIIITAGLMDTDMQGYIVNMNDVLALFE